MTGKVKQALGYEPSVKYIKDILGDRVVAYYPDIAKKLKNKNAALMLQQLTYWQCRTADPAGWFYKTIKDIYDELALSRTEQDTAIHILIEHELIETKDRRQRGRDLERVAGEVRLRKYLPDESDHEGGKDERAQSREDRV